MPELIPIAGELVPTWVAFVLSEHGIDADEIDEIEWCDPTVERPEASVQIKLRPRPVVTIEMTIGKAAE